MDTDSNDSMLAASAAAAFREVVLRNKLNTSRSFDEMPCSPIKRDAVERGRRSLLNRTKGLNSSFENSVICSTNVSLGTQRALKRDELSSRFRERSPGPKAAQRAANMMTQLAESAKDLGDLTAKYGRNARLVAEALRQVRHTPEQTPCRVRSPSNAELKRKVFQFQTAKLRSRRHCDDVGFTSDSDDLAKHPSKQRLDTSVIEQTADESFESCRKRPTGLSVTPLGLQRPIDTACVGSHCDNCQALLRKIHYLSEQMVKRDKAFAAKVGAAIDDTSKWQMAFEDQRETCRALALQLIAVRRTVDRAMVWAHEEASRAALFARRNEEFGLIVGTLWREIATLLIRSQGEQRSFHNDPTQADPKREQPKLRTKTPTKQPSPRRHPPVQPTVLKQFEDKSQQTEISEVSHHAMDLHCTPTHNPLNHSPPIATFDLDPGVDSGAVKAHVGLAPGEARRIRELLRKASKAIERESLEATDFLRTHTIPPPRVKVTTTGRYFSVSGTAKPMDGLPKPPELTE